MTAHSLDLRTALAQSTRRFMTVRWIGHPHHLIRDAVSFSFVWIIGLADGKLRLN
jgi:hypothetical protein